MRQCLWVVGLLCATSASAGVHAQTRPVPLEPQTRYGGEGATAHPVSRPTAAEVRTGIRFRAAQARGALALHAFLVEMPKGADLHMHLSGAVYAETLIKDAVEDDLCVNVSRMALVRNRAEQPVAQDSAPQPVCAQGQVPAASAFTNQTLYDELVDSFSMRAFVPFTGRDGHDQFFATFEKFGGLKSKHAGEWLDEVATRAAAQNVQYLEVMQTPTFSHAAKLGYKAGWSARIEPATSAGSSDLVNISAGASRSELAALRLRLLTAGLRDEVAVDRAEFAAALSERQKVERCGTPAAVPACSVQVRFIYQVLRAFPPQQVFAQALLAFEVASADPEVVGINFVQPEDSYEAMSEYHRQMMMLDYLHSVYPAVHISLHAGELAPGMVPPAGLSFHIREAVQLGHAERIGHGVDLMYETNPERLLRQMAAQHVMVEINLTSNDVILGVQPNHHSLPEYRAAGVPVALSTDDEGVSRIDLTHEYARAATDFHLQYSDLKRMARTSLEHAFLPGASLWAHADQFDGLAGPCSGQDAGKEDPSATCAGLLRDSARAANQWELEKRFRRFEADTDNRGAAR